MNLLYMMQNMVTNNQTCLKTAFIAFVAGFPPQTSPSHIKIGDKVRVKPTVTTPKYKWGSVTHRSVGVVKGNELILDKTWV